MSFKIADLFAEIRADARPLNEALTTLHGKLQGTSNLLGGVAKAAAGLFTAALLWKALKESVAEFAGSEMALIRLEGALKATGQASAGAMRQMQDYARTIQSMTILDEDEVIAAQQFATSLGIQADRMAEAMDAAVGLSRALQMDLATATRYVAMAFEGEFTILQRYIPELRAAGTETEKLALLQQKAAEGMAIARAEATTTAGAWKRLGINIMDAGAAAVEFSGLAGLLKDLSGTTAIEKSNKELDEFLAKQKRVQAEWDEVHILPGVDDELALAKAAAERHEAVIQTLRERRAAVEDAARAEFELDKRTGRAPADTTAKTRREYEDMLANAQRMADAMARDADEKARDQEARDKRLADQKRRAMVDVVGQIMDEDRAHAEAADREGKRTEEERRRKVGVYSGLVEFGERLQSAILQGKPQEAAARPGTTDERMVQIVRDQLDQQRKQTQLLEAMKVALQREQLDVPADEM